MKSFNGYKKCCKCQCIYPLIIFNRNKSRKDGFQSECRDCGKEKDKKHYQKNIIIERRKSLDYYYNHREEISEKKREYLKDHREEINRKRREKTKKEREECNKLHPELIPKEGYKFCSKCNEEFPATSEYFYRNKESKDKLKSDCKECRNKDVSDWYNNNKKYARIRSRLYYKTHKESYIKSKAKRRKMNYIEMFENPFDESEEVEWHHINDCYVVAIPSDLHKLYYGNKKLHRGLCMNIVKQIYLEEYNG